MKKPAYVINIPVKVSSDQAETSEGLSPDGTFPQESFDNPPYEIDHNKSGYVEKIILPPARKVKVREGDVASSDPLVKKIIETGMSSDGKKVDESFKDRTGIVLGLNKRRSIRKKHNQSLYRTVRDRLESTIPVAKIGLFWKPVWKNKLTKTGADFYEVRKFYRQLKKHNPVAAKKFIKETEGKPRGDTIPYGGLRNVIKGHKKTRKFIKKFQSQHSVYYAFQDADPVTLRTQSGQPLFGFYDQLIESHSKKHEALPEVISTGYRIAEEGNPLAALGVELDLWVRHFTAKSFPTGVYYPEPNTLIRVLPNRPTLEADFPCGANEMKGLLKTLITRRRIHHSKKEMVFDANGAITTGAPSRIKDKKFRAYKNQNDEIVLWGLKDMRAIKNVSQSHNNGFQWANYLIQFQTISSRDNLTAKEVKEILVSLISRLFNHYDPVCIAQQGQQHFQENLIDVLEPDCYEEIIENTRLMPIEGDRKDTKLGNVLSEMDKIDDIEILKQKIDEFWPSQETDEQYSELVEKAARESLQHVVDILRNDLCLEFVQLSMVLMSTFFDGSYDKKADVEMREMEIARASLGMPIGNPMGPVSVYSMLLREWILLEHVGGELHLAVLEDRLLNEEQKNISNNYLNAARDATTKDRKGFCGTTPMHWAAITGNKAAIEGLKKRHGKQLNWLGAIDEKAEFDVLPLHCAIRYCADNGDDIELIKQLANKGTVLANFQEHRNVGARRPEEPKYKSNSILQAFMELPDPKVIVKHLCEVAEIPLETKQELLELIEKSKEEERAAPVLCAMQYNKSLDLIRCLLEWGAHPDATNKEFEDTPSLCEAISPLDGHPRSDSLDLVKLLIKYGADVDRSDEDDNYPLGLAISEKNKKIAEILLKHGAYVYHLSVEERVQLGKLMGNAAQFVEEGEELENRTEKKRFF